MLLILSPKLMVLLLALIPAEFWPSVVIVLVPANTILPPSRLIPLEADPRVITVLSVNPPVAPDSKRSPIEPLPKVSIFVPVMATDVVALSAYTAVALELEPNTPVVIKLSFMVVVPD